MHIGLVFYSETIALASQASTVNGRSVANNHFLKTLLASKGSHRVTLFTASRLEKGLLENFLGTEELRGISIIAFIDMEAFLKKNDLDVLHIPGPDLYRALYLRNAFGKNFAVTGLTHSLGHQPFLEWLLLAREQRPQACDRLVCTSPTAEAVCRSLLQQVQMENMMQTALIPLGIDVTSFEEGKSIRRVLQIPEDAVVFLSLGRLSYVTKADLMPLLMLFSRISRSSRRLYWIISGSTGNEDDAYLLEKQAQELGIHDNVRIIANPNEEMKLGLYKTADVFLAPNDNPQETFGLSILEASASGLPVIASDWNGYRSLVQDGVDGYLIPTTTLSSHRKADMIAPVQMDSLNHFYFSQGTATDIEVFGDKMRILADDSVRRAEMGMAARKKAAGYDWSIVISRYFSLWETLGRAETRAATYRPMNYRETFSAYASQVLQDKDTFETSPTGVEVLSTRNFFQYFLSDEIFSQDLLFDILEGFKTPQSVEDLYGHLGKIAPETLGHHLLWLYKYGFLSRKSS